MTMMNCTTARNALTAGASPDARRRDAAAPRAGAGADATGAPARDRELQRHLDDCTACRTYAQRVAAARRYFGEHHANAQPDGAFVARVRSRLETGPVELMGRAALRLLPACAALVLVLGWVAWQTTTTTPAADDLGGAVTGTPAYVEDEVVSPTEDLLAWVLEDEGAP